MYDTLTMAKFMDWVANSPRFNSEESGIVIAAASAFVAAQASDRRGAETNPSTLLFNEKLTLTEESHGK